VEKGGDDGKGDGPHQVWKQTYGLLILLRADWELFPSWRSIASGKLAVASADRVGKASASPSSRCVWKSVRYAFRSASETVNRKVLSKPRDP